MCLGLGQALGQGGEETTESGDDGPGNGGHTECGEAGKTKRELNLSMRWGHCLPGLLWSHGLQGGPSDYYKWLERKTCEITAYRAAFGFNDSKQGTSRGAEWQCSSGGGSL